MGDPIINTQVDDINTTLGNIKVDLAALRPSIRAIRDAIAETYLTDTIENVPIASFNDGADDIPVRELQVAINPIQSLNGQTSPYPAGGGKNKLSSEWQSGSYGSNGNKINDDTKIRTASAINVSANTTYTLSFAVARSGGGLVCYYTDDAFISRASIVAVNPTFTTPATCTRVTFAVPVESDGTTLKAQLELGSSATDWTPYSNICPISGHTEVNVVRTGKNLLTFLNSRTSNGITFTYDETTGAMSVSGTATANAYSDGTASISTASKYVYLPKGTYYVSLNGTLNTNNFPRYYIQQVTKDGTATLAIAGYSDASFELTDDAYVYFRIQVGSGETVNTTLYPQIAKAQSDFEAPQSATYPITLGQTVYGGTLNVTTGVLTVTHRVGTTAGNESSMTVQIDLGHLFRVTWGGGIAPFAGLQQAYPDGCLCNMYGRSDTSYVNMASDSTDMAFAITGTLGTTLLISDSSVASIADMVARITASPIEVYYPLATPTTVQLTAAEIESLFGANNVWSDSNGNVVKLTYRKAWEIALAEGE